MLIYVLTNTKKSRIRTERSGFESNEKDSIMYEDIYGADGKTGRGLTLSNDSMFILGGKADRNEAGCRGVPAVCGGTVNSTTVQSGGSSNVFGDEIDFRRFEIAHGAKLKFGICSDDATKFTIWKYDEKKGKPVPARTTKARKHKLKMAIRKISPDSATTKEFLPSPGEFFFSVQSPNAKKAKAGAAYSLLIYSKVGGVNRHSKKTQRKTAAGKNRNHKSVYYSHCESANTIRFLS